MYDEENERKRREYYESKRKRNRPHSYQSDVPGDRENPEGEEEEEEDEEKVEPGGPINCNTGLPFEERAEEEEEDMLGIFELRSLARHNLTTGCSRNGTLYAWTKYDYLSTPFALVVGSLNALGKGS